MADRLLFENSIAAMATNPQQLQAVNINSHCVVLAGPGSGKTRTLTTSMAKTLLDEVLEPRGIACITYNNECALELETRLSSLGIEPSDRIFIGTVHSFALSQVIMPYARCVYPNFPTNISVASRAQQEDAVKRAYVEAINDGGNPKDVWFAASKKRKQCINRQGSEWLDNTPRLSRLIEAYEAELRRNGLIDFDDMTLIAVRMITENDWIKRALKAKFPVLFVDEYQDLGAPLHELVLQLCFEAGIRLFAVGDPDQSIYRFAGANPELLKNLSKIDDVTTITLPFNYRCGTSIIEASNAALGEERSYKAPEGTPTGNIVFDPVDGDLNEQARYIFNTLIPSFVKNGVKLESIAVLYRDFSDGDLLAEVAEGHKIAYVRSDKNALIPRNNRLSRFIESCAKWATGGWKTGDPKFRRLCTEGQILVYGRASREEKEELKTELVRFLHETIDSQSTHEWLKMLKHRLIGSWRSKARTLTDDWDVLDKMIERTSPIEAQDMALPLFAGHVEETGRLNLSTLHSAKGREFDIVIIFGMNAATFPDPRDVNNQEALRETRRLFYVGVTRAKTELHLVFRRKHFTPWVLELYRRLNPVKRP